MLQAADVSFAYADVTVLDRVSLGVSRGAIVGILGPNGSGKTTLLGLLAGTLRPSSGRITLDGAALHALPRQALARRLAVVPQETHPAFAYTVLEIALMGRYPHLGAFELEGPEDVEAACRALASTGTLSLANRPFETLSGGEKQRVVIASALAQFEPRRGAHAPHRDSAERRHPASGAWILLLDEPTASLDLHYVIEVVTLLRRLNVERGLTIVISTHDLNVAASICHELVLLRQGRVLAAGPTDQVLTPAAVRELYGVEADIQHHDAAGHLTVVPLPPAQV